MDLANQSQHQDPSNLRQVHLMLPYASLLYSIVHEYSMSQIEVWMNRLLTLMTKNVSKDNSKYISPQTSKKMTRTTGANRDPHRSGPRQRPLQLLMRP